MPTVSVILNLYNGAATVAEAIDSVLSQSFVDWELLVWDDASDDGGGAIVSRFVDKRIRYLRSEERFSLGQARQKAIQSSRGEWIAFLDQDDLWLPQKLQQQLQRAAQNPMAGLIYGRTVRFYPNGAERDYDQAHEYEPLPEGNIFSSLFTESCYIAMSSAMFRREALENVGPIPAEVRIIPDYWLYTAVTRDFPAVAVQEVVCRYRMHRENASRTSVVAVQEEALRLMDMWQADVDAATLNKCRRYHATQMALAEMRSSGSFLRGLRRLLQDGSVWSQLVRPFLWVFHRVRRSLVNPYWKRT